MGGGAGTAAEDEQARREGGAARTAAVAAHARRGWTAAAWPRARRASCVLVIVERVEEHLREVEDGRVEECDEDGAEDGTDCRRMQHGGTSTHGWRATQEARKEAMTVSQKPKAACDSLYRTLGALGVRMKGSSPAVKRALEPAAVIDDEPDAEPIIIS